MRWVFKFPSNPKDSMIQSKTKNCRALRLSQLALVCSGFHPVAVPDLGSVEERCV